MGEWVGVTLIHASQRKIPRKIGGPRENSVWFRDRGRYFAACLPGGGTAAFASKSRHWRSSIWANVPPK